MDLYFQQCLQNKAAEAKTFGQIQEILLYSTWVYSYDEWQEREY